MLVPIERAMNVGKSQAAGLQGARTETLTQIMGPLEDMLRSMSAAAPKAGKRSSLGKDPDSGAPLSERVDRIVAECGARQATLSQLQLELTRSVHPEAE